MNGLTDLAVSMLPRPGRSILIVDDEEHITAAIKDYFTFLGYQVDCAGDETAAQALLDCFEYTAVITDLRLSGSDRMEGMDIVERVRNRQPTAACIVLTSYGDPANEVEACKRGADALLQKPTPLRVLAERLAEILDYRNS